MRALGNPPIKIIEKTYCKPIFWSILNTVQQVMKGNNMKQVIDFVGVATLGVVLGLMFAYALLGGF